MPKPPAPTWEKSSPDLVAFFESLAPQEPGIVYKKMFGYPACFVHGNLFVSLFKQNLLFRLSRADFANFLKLDGAGPFEPMPGRRSKGFAILTEPSRRDPKFIAHWIVRSLEFARSLPAKDKTKPTTKKGARARK
ncbi:MAG TPA: TfoX/Sxy family protein [Bryobacteraceae bacterium]|nr:TfoX/Sxy family protein [Bryobacteraceae bacterium]